MKTAIPLMIVILFFLKSSFALTAVFSSFDEKLNDIKRCECVHCDSKTTVGILYTGHCYYININDRI